MTSPFAVFAVALLPCGAVAATSRAADRGEAGKIGLPGGKVDPGESPREALLREASEEGWLLSGVEETPFHVATVEGKTVAWFRAQSAQALVDFKEKGRIAPLKASREALAASGYGNDLAFLAL
jgi:ADP-ribose pyrophosphatase YjhB (NUDIX family)